MKIKELLNRNKVNFSCEIFPPKKDTDFSEVFDVVDRIGELGADYISVTYGAGGSTSKKTVEVASYIQNQKQTTALAHLTCIDSTPEQIQAQLAELKANGIENIMALRGDKPKDFTGPYNYNYAIELIRDIHASGDFCVGAACYPEGHVECPHKQEDISHLKGKVDAGVDFLTTQMFFDNNIFYNFLCRVREAGIDVPVIPGIMPITKPVQLRNAVKLSGCNVPMRFRSIVDCFGSNPKAMQQAGIIYATDQIIDLIANGVKHVHVYSMNNAEVVKGIQENLCTMIG